MDLVSHGSRIFIVCGNFFSEISVSCDYPFSKLSKWVNQKSHTTLYLFGNPFKKTSSKGSQLSQRPLFLLNAFELALTARLQKLNPKDKHDVLSLAWMWIDVYMDISVKLLDICNALSSELLRLNQGHLLLQCALHNLESNTSDKLVRALSLPKVKNSAKGKVLMQAMYGAKIQTVFVCSVAAAVFSDLGRRAEKLAQGLDFLTKVVDGFFKIVLSGRDALLCDLRMPDTLADPFPGSNGKRFVR
ncbi:hypothetical protein OIU78_011439 [Salix suchowensis]|nr:hypothetical protein OIU78_011439 [Salix suchowensis]